MRPDVIVTEWGASHRNHEDNRLREHSWKRKGGPDAAYCGAVVDADMSNVRSHVDVGCEDGDSDNASMYIKRWRTASPDVCCVRSFPDAFLFKLVPRRHFLI